MTQEAPGNGGAASSPTGDIVTNRSYDAVTGWVNSIQSGVGGGTGESTSLYYDSSHAFQPVLNLTDRQALRTM